MKKKVQILSFATACVVVIATGTFLMLRDVGFIPPTMKSNPTYETDLEKAKARFAKSIEKYDDILDFYYSDAVRITPASLGIKPDSVIADIGCGTGAFEMMLLVKKTDFAKLYAVDIDKNSLDFLRYCLDKIKMPGREKIITHHSVNDDVMLQADSIDIGLAVNTRIGQRPYKAPFTAEVEKSIYRVINTIHHMMKPGGKLHIFEPVKMLDVDGGLYPLDWVIDGYVKNGFKLVSSEQLDLGIEYFHAVFQKDGP
jgi:SAM-dependent methyltransferase